MVTRYRQAGRDFHGDQARRRDRRRADGQRHRPRLRAGGLRRRCCTTSPRRRSRRRPASSAATWTARSQRGRISRGRARRRAGADRRSSPTSRRSARCDLVIEAATEKEPLKHAIFKALVPHLAPHTILTSNTSSISITRLASGTDRPERFMGFHFMNPVPVMQLVELIRGIATDEPTYETMLGARREDRQDLVLGRGLPGLHRQPHPDADDQRGGLHALRGRRHRRPRSTPR